MTRGGAWVCGVSGVPHKEGCSGGIVRGSGAEGPALQTRTHSGPMSPGTANETVDMS